MSKRSVDETESGCSSSCPKDVCLGVLDDLTAHRFAFPFNEPVDYIALGIPDYPMVIAKPMDLGTIRKKLANNDYENIEDFSADVKLTFQNALTYSTPNSDINIMATTLLEYFDKLMTEGERPFSFAEKKRLSDKMSTLSPQKLARVVTILAEFHGETTDSICVDLDVLDNKTLRKLEQLTLD